MRLSTTSLALTIAGATAAVSLAAAGSALAGGSACLVPVPEPSTLALLASGVAGILYLHRRTKKR